jgi:hypothetical protein
MFFFSETAHHDAVADCIPFAVLELSPVLTESGSLQSPRNLPTASTSQSRMQTFPIPSVQPLIELLLPHTSYDTFNETSEESCMFQSARALTEPSRQQPAESCTKQSLKMVLKKMVAVRSSHQAPSESSSKHSDKQL